MAASDAELRRPVPRGEVGERREHRHRVRAGQVVAGEAERLVGARALLRHRVVEDVGVVGVPVLRLGAAPRDGGAEGVQRERGAEHGAVAQQWLEQRMVDELSRGEMAAVYERAKEEAEKEVLKRMLSTDVDLKM